ncbi:metal ABC transporter ATP-binding protein [Pseudalkalibacillus berkeleyi]|uniref:Metal ABC transporter ATP-binding protein n=1 Tax=Pseudalkalibacillus berkeleyi TaxID=1069813 RepID=A0ABS9GYT8_9BACL|nr:metal ABC transporter ATP-binding protein [Pseudalkalibacillus berkeleyi]MCF6137937.1 metal ABC transporter ATP-binding protein [Pseudalkalibacillus berkeleyi]
MKSSVVSIKDVSFSYQDRNVLEHINLEVPEGSFLALLGPNGSGKSTLIKILLGLNPLQTGQVELFGVNLRKFKAWNKIGYVSQKANSFNTGFPATVFEVVSMGLFGKIGMFNFMNKAHKKRVREALKTVGLEEYAKQNIGELSGGQQQRAFIARALVSDPKLLILDEPTVGVDASSVEDFYELLKRLNQQYGITLLLVTHDMGPVTNLVTHVACLNKKLHFHGNTTEYERMDNRDLSAFYGHPVHAMDHHHHD